MQPHFEPQANGPPPHLLKIKNENSCQNLSNPSSFPRQGSAAVHDPGVRSLLARQHPHLDAQRLSAHA